MKKIQLLILSGVVLGAATFSTVCVAQPTNEQADKTAIYSQPGPWHIVSDGVNNYWTDYKAGTVMKSPIAGGETTTLATNQSGPCGISVVGNSVFWANFNGGTIMTVSADGGTPATIASKQNHPSVVGTTTNNVYWATDSDFMKMSIKGGTPVRQEDKSVSATGESVDPSGHAVHCELCPIYCKELQLDANGHAYWKTYVCNYYSCNCK